MTATSKAESVDWALFTDWCAAARAPALPTNHEVIQAFLDELPAARSTRLARVRTIRIRHARLGMPDPDSPAAAPSVGSDPVLPGMLAALPVHGWPAGVAGRRDAFLLVLYKGLRLTREQIRSTTPGDLDVDSQRLRVRDHSLPPAQAPGQCLACAVTRWLRLLNLAEQRDWPTVRRSMAGRWTERAGDQELYDCHRPLGDAWRRTTVLLPQIDQHGWTEDQSPLTVRSITEVAARRGRQFAALDVPETTAGPGPMSILAAPPGTRWDRRRTLDELAELDPLLDRLDAEIDAALQRAKGLLTGPR